MKIYIVLVMCVFLSGCISLAAPMYGSIKTDPGVRIYKLSDNTIIHITYKNGENPPDYTAISTILKELK